ncbi:hypothetical protein ACQP00_16325 [Dactylosporangium sp. CS-047395]|uniref:hypothetical protein n=1 Tax=Dactylosporangium sp. CS-047395 TaxID=3239936 RepID=UPI003D8B5E55
MSIVDVLRAGQAPEVMAAVAGLTEAERRVEFKALEAYVKQESEPWYGPASIALAVATVGTAPSSAAAARILRRRLFPLAADAIAATGRARGVPWLADLGARLDTVWPVAAALVETPPDGDWFVTGWLDDLNFPAAQELRSVPIVDRLRTDRFLDALLPRVFTSAEAGNHLLIFDPNNQRGGDLAIVEALAALAAEGRLARADLLTAALSRLLRGGDRRQGTRAFLALLTALSPTPAEASAHAGDYLRLLSDGPVTVATAAQKVLRGARELDLDAVLEASRAVLLRPDKGLVKAQRTWLGALARAYPARRAEIEALLEAPAPALLPVTVPLPAPPAVAPAPAPIADPDELAEEVAAFYSDRPFSALLPLERILDGVVRLAAGDRTALARALQPVVERHRAGMGEHRWDPNCVCGTFTRLLQTAIDPGLAPAATSGWASLLAAARRFLSLGESPPDRRIPPPQRLLRARLAEIGLHLGSDSLPAGGLLSAPTWSNGVLDTDVLLARLAAFRPGDPWPWDLAQAMLRLPPGPDLDSAARAEALKTPAGSRLGTWLRGYGLPKPAWQVEVRPRRPKKHGGDWDFDTLPTLRVEVTTAPPETPKKAGAAGAAGTMGTAGAAGTTGTTGSAGTTDAAATTGAAEAFGLLGTAAPPVGVGSNGWHVLWPGMLPWHRGLVAAFALSDVAATADMDQRGGGAILPLLAETHGEGGPALAIAVAYGLTARHEADRLAAVDALLLLAATDSFDAETAGHYLGLLAVGGAIKVNRAVEPLRDAAAAGAPHVVFRVLAAALPAMLAAPTTPRGTPDLLAIAAETAAAGRGVTHPTSDTTATAVGCGELRGGSRDGGGDSSALIAGLAEVAARKGASRLVVEARRLVGALDGPERQKSSSKETVPVTPT